MQCPRLSIVITLALLLQGCASLRPPPIASDDPAAAGQLRERIDAYMQQRVADGYSGAVMVMRGDAAILSKGYGIADRGRGVAATDRTLFQLASVTKPFTAAAILKLQMEGRLRVTDPVTRFFDDVPADKRAITIHQLLTHTSGMPHRVGICWPPSSKLDRDGYVREVLAADLDAAPGRAFAYSNDGYGLLGAIIERASGRSYEQYLREELFAPAGMTRTGYTFDETTLQDAARGYAGRDEYLGNLNPAFRNQSGPA
ncbi:MAG: serine hydrolase [Lysobacter sp.]|nr:serine hydrolase [Lysobacter sp.]